MAKQYSVADVATDAVIETAIASLLATFSTNKVSDILPVLDRTAALRVLTKRCVKLNTTNRVRSREANTFGVSQ
jgi:hypothetical protein